MTHDERLSFKVVAISSELSVQVANEQLGTSLSDFNLGASEQVAGRSIIARHAPDETQSKPV